MFKPEILLETDKFIAINKPAGLLSIPDREGKEPSLKSWLREKYGNIFTVHRLDRDTSGVIVFAKDEETHKMLSEAFEKRDVTKIYQGLVQGSLEQSKGTIDLPIMEHPTRPGAMVVNRHGKASVTDYEVVEDLGLYSLIQFQIHTGRTHQIRVHMQAIGHPIVCDEVYGDPQPVRISSFKRNFKLSKDQEEERPILSRLALHSQLLSFQEYTIEAPLPKDIRALLQQLKKWKKG